MNILTTSQIRELDAYAIEHEPIRSIDLMERAATAVADKLTTLWPAGTPLVVFAGPGNNGGDALAVARLMSERGYDVTAYLFTAGRDVSEDCHTNRQRLAMSSARFNEVTSRFDPPRLTPECVVIDGLFGTGLSRPLEGGFAALVKFINASPAPVVSIDVPSGLLCERDADPSVLDVVRATYTLTFQCPKLNFLLPDAQPYVGRLSVLDIGLPIEVAATWASPYELLEADKLRALLHRRPAFAHKGTFGHGLLMAGSEGMAGAAVLAARAALRGGIGKLTVHGPRANRPVLQATVPEALYHADSDESVVADPVPASSYSALAIGPGLGGNSLTARAFVDQLSHTSIPTLIDADGLNLLAAHPNWLTHLRPGTILTPHVGEMERLLGHKASSFGLLSRASELAVTRQAHVVLKGHYTAICSPDGKVAFNPTGNSGMATAGSGDVLTGLLLALLAQGYAPAEACRLGVYLHGLAGDLAAADLGEESLVASDLVAYLPRAFRQLRTH